MSHGDGTAGAMPAIAPAVREQAHLPGRQPARQWMAAARKGGGHSNGESA